MITQKTGTIIYDDALECYAITFDDSATPQPITDGQLVSLYADYHWVDVLFEAYTTQFNSGWKIKAANPGETIGTLNMGGDITGLDVRITQNDGKPDPAGIDLAILDIYHASNKDHLKTLNDIFFHNITLTMEEQQALVQLCAIDTEAFQHILSALKKIPS